MKFTLSWLKEYTSVEYTPSEIAEKLTMAGLEVDSFANRFEYLDKVVVSRVEYVEKHPAADNLTCCKVNVGKNTAGIDMTGDDIILNIVCGAPNVRKGLVVPCAIVGALLPGDLEIKKSKLRGEISEGMLCSAAELKLGLGCDGIMELDPAMVPGTPLAEALSLNDYLFEVDLTPNRPDCLSVIGLAREVAAFSDPAGKLCLPFNDIIRCSDKSIHDYVAVEIFDPDLCPRYTAGMVVDVKIGPSPFWLQDRLVSLGLTPINNVVDVTNFVMMETGQPLHAFDYDNIAGSRIEIKRAGIGCIEFRTLDGKSHTLEPDMLMICDGDRPVGIAGVMGGENTEILDSTTRVLVESACFNPVSIRRTAKRSGINTDASHRFERGVDPDATKDVLKRAISLISEVSGGTILNDIIDQYPVPHTPFEIKLDPDALNRRLGTSLTYDEIKQYLESVQFKVNQSDGIIKCDDSMHQDKNSTEQDRACMMRVIVPSFRVDVTRPEDLSEEVARLWGYNRIQTSFPKVPAKGRAPSERIVMREQIRDIMNGFGFSEAVNYSFTSAAACDLLCLELSDKRRSVEEILNPISEELSVLRTSLLPGLLENIRRNNSQQIDSVRLFEIGNIFLATRKGEQPIEKEMIAGIWTGLRTGISWSNKPVACDFFDIKGVVQSLCCALDIDEALFKKSDVLQCPYYQNGHGAIIAANGNQIGSVGKIGAQILKNFGLKQDVFVFEMDMEVVLSIAPPPGAMKNTHLIPKFPSLSRDLTLILDSGVAVGSILSDFVAFKENKSVLEDVFIFDLYEGKPLPEGKKSLSIRIVYRSWEKTLSEKMINGVHADISRHIMEKYGADLP
ncbi:MAG: phenylalanine--tRNA ligase subunit beta [Desulfamplus sp.]|nr:phenylalanine--tRNA ligase subunit beta [Desulfamplus sp.]